MNRKAVIHPVSGQRRFVPRPGSFDFLESY
jgi:hypothetical protein